jgi:hypothetical protein
MKGRRFQLMHHTPRNGPPFEFFGRRSRRGRRALDGLGDVRPQNRRGDIVQIERDFAEMPGRVAGVGAGQDAKRFRHLVYGNSRNHGAFLQ